MTTENGTQEPGDLDRHEEKTHTHTHTHIYKETEIVRQRCESCKRQKRFSKSNLESTTGKHFLTDLLAYS
jgi:hypothetical protein